MNEHPKFIKHYQVINIIDRGSIGIVYKVFDTIKKCFFACKFVLREDLENRGLFSNFEQELRLQESLNHKNILLIENIIFEKDFIAVILEFCEEGDLLTFLKNHHNIPRDLLIYIYWQILEGMKYLHNKKISHCDLKLDNILLTNDYIIKIADFGCAFEEGLPFHHIIQGTLFYLPPEVISQEVIIPKKQDIWALGIILYGLFTKKFPWFDELPDHLIRKQIKTGLIEFDTPISQDIKEIIRLCTKYNPYERISVEEILKLNFFNQINLIKKNYEKK